MQYFSHHHSLEVALSKGFDNPHNSYQISWVSIIFQFGISSVFIIIAGILYFKLNKLVHRKKALFCFLSNRNLFCFLNQINPAKFFFLYCIFVIKMMQIVINHAILGLNFHLA